MSAIGAGHIGEVAASIGAERSVNPAGIVAREGLGHGGDGSHGYTVLRHAEQGAEEEGQE